MAASPPYFAPDSIFAPDVRSACEPLGFELTVTDVAGLRSRDTCIVNVVSDTGPPISRAGADQTVIPGKKIILDGSGSTAEGEITSYNWRQIAGLPVTLSDPGAVRPAFLTPVIDSTKEDLIFVLTITDSARLQDKAKVTVTVVNGPAMK